MAIEIPRMELGTLAQWCAIVASGSLGVAGFLLGHSERRRRLELDFDLARAKVREDIQIFIEGAKEAYQAYHASCGLPEGIEQFINRVGPLPNPPRKVEDPHLWRSRNAGNLSHDKVLCLAFAAKLYPPKGGGKPSSDLSSAFHGARARVAHFWDTWGPRISLAYIRKNHEYDAMIVSLLSWVEICLYESLNTPSQKIRFLKFAGEFRPTAHL